MSFSRRDFSKLIAGAGVFAAATQLGQAASIAQSVGGDYRAMVGVFLYGGHDGWNMLVPTDGRYSAYASARGSALALRQQALTPLAGVPFGLHPSLAPLKKAWTEGALASVVNTGSLLQPLNRTMLAQRPDLAPLNLMSHSDEQNHWEGMQVRNASQTGFLGRLADRMAPTATPSLISFAGSSLALIGSQSSPLILPYSGGLERQALRKKEPVALIANAMGAYNGADAPDALTRQTGVDIAAAYDQATAANAVVGAASAAVDKYFIDPATGKTVISKIGLQLLGVARMIEARARLGHAKQTFFVSQQGYDMHADQVEAGDSAKGAQALLYADLGQALACFYEAMKGLGLQRNVTAFTMSDFGRVYKGNAQNGTDHGWGNNHLVLGGALVPQKVHGRYPDQALGGAEDAKSDGRWIPSIAIEEYVGAVAQWYGVAAADMPYVFPNWSTWSGGGRGPVPLFG